MLFLFWGLGTLSINTILSCYALWISFNWLVFVISLVNVYLVLNFSLMLITFLVLLAGNFTTIELRYAHHGTSPYDVGVLPNIKQVFGNDYILWLLPITIARNGITFPRNSELPQVTIV